MLTVVSLLFLVLTLAAISAIFEIRTILREVYKLLWNETKGKLDPSEIRKLLPPRR